MSSCVLFCYVSVQLEGCRGLFCKISITDSLGGIVRITPAFIVYEWRPFFLYTGSPQASTLRPDKEAA